MSEEWFVDLQDARSRLASSDDGERAAFVMQHGSMRIGLYAPKDVDRQAPHGQDELYLVLAGTGGVVVAGEHRWCEPGNVIFVAAGMEHRFETFSADFEVCVVFWGADGGERMPSQAADEGE